MCPCVEKMFVLNGADGYSLCLQDMARYMILVESASVNAQDNAGWTPLHEACSSSNSEMAELLLHNGADANISSRDGTRYACATTISWSPSTADEAWYCPIRIAHDGACLFMGRGGLLIVNIYCCTQNHTIDMLYLFLCHVT